MAEFRWRSLLVGKLCCYTWVITPVGVCFVEVVGFYVGVRLIMNKQEAANYLGISTRGIERYTQKGKLTVKYEGGKTRPIAVYDEQELAKLKEELNTVSYKPAVVDSDLESSALEASSTSQIGLNTDNASYGLSELINQLEKLTKTIESFKAIEGNRGVPSVPISEKLVLSLKEAQALTGFSRERLREAIKDGSLKAQKIGNGWKVKRRDLDFYVESL